MRSFTVLTAAACLFLAGCQKLNVERSYAMQEGQTEALIVDAPKFKQKVDVTVTSTQAPVNAGIYHETDGKPSGAPLASQKNAKEITLSADIEAKKGFLIQV